jgi:hypothetical protein
LYKKLKPISLRKAIERDLEEAEHKHDDSQPSTTTISTTSVVEAPSTTPSIIVAATCPTVGDQSSQGQNEKEATKKRCQDWNGTGEDEDDDALHLGLRVYSKNHVVVTIHAQLKSEA